MLKLLPEQWQKDKLDNCVYFYNFSYSRPHTNRPFFEELLKLREYKRQKEREESTTNLYDLIVYSLEDGETIAKYSTEHLTGFAFKEGKLIVCNQQLKNADEHMANEVGFCFRGR